MVGREDCDLCVQECNAAGYHAIEYIQVGTQTDEQGVPIEGTGMLAPVVLEDKCVGCGLCQTRCYGINVKEKKLLTESAIIIEAGQGKEDRLMSGSYIALRQQEEAKKRVSTKQDSPTKRIVTPESSVVDDPSEVDSSEEAANPFGL